MFAVNVVRNVGNRARTVQGVHGNEVTEAVRLQVLHVLFHAVGFKLENGVGFAPLEELVGFFVVQRNIINRRCSIAVILLDQPQAFLDDGQVAQTQKVHLDYTRILNNFPFILGNNQVRIFRGRHRNNVG